MGATNLKTIEYSEVAGNPPWARTTHNMDWPRVEIANYTRVIDYDTRSSREERTRRQGNNPTQGRTPLKEERVSALLTGNFA